MGKNNETRASLVKLAVGVVLAVAGVKLGQKGCNELMGKSDTGKQISNS